MMRARLGSLHLVTVHSGQPLLSELGKSILGVTFWARVSSRGRLEVEEAPSWVTIEVNKNLPRAAESMLHPFTLAVGA